MGHSQMERSWLPTRQSIAMQTKASTSTKQSFFAALRIERVYISRRANSDNDSVHNRYIYVCCIDKHILR